jgi:hypothetical protein
VPSCGSDTIVGSASRTSRWCSHAVAVTRPPPSVAHTYRTVQACRGPLRHGAAARGGGRTRRPPRVPA